MDNDNINGMRAKKVRSFKGEDKEMAGENEERGKEKEKVNVNVNVEMKENGLWRIKEFKITKS